MTDVRARRRLHALARREGIDAAAIAGRLQLSCPTVEAVLAAARRGQRPASLLEVALGDMVDEAIVALRAGTPEPAAPEQIEEPEPQPEPEPEAPPAAETPLTERERAAVEAIRAAAAEAGDPGTLYARAAVRIGSRSAHSVAQRASQLRKRGVDLPSLGTEGKRTARRKSLERVTGWPEITHRTEAAITRLYAGRRYDNGGRKP